VAVGSGDPDGTARDAATANSLVVASAVAGSGLPGVRDGPALVESRDAAKPRLPQTATVTAIATPAAASAGWAARRSEVPVDRLLDPSEARPADHDR